MHFKRRIKAGYVILISNSKLKYTDSVCNICKYMFNDTKDMSKSYCKPIIFSCIRDFSTS